MTTTLAVTSVGRRCYVLEALLRAKSESETLITIDQDPTVPGLAVPGAVPIRAPAAGVTPAFLQQHDVDAVLSLHDYEAVALAEASAELNARGVQFIGPDVQTVTTLLDKYALASHVAAASPGNEVMTLPPDHLPAPDTAQWVLKDRFGSSSSGLQIVSSRSRARKIAADRQQTLSWHPSGTPQPTEMVAQPFLAGREFNVDLFLDSNSRVSGHCIKEKIAMRGGETDSAHVTQHDHYGLVDAITRALSGLSLKGNVDIDVIRHADGLAILDINPRFGGGYAFSSLAGYDAADGIWQLARRRSIDIYYSPTRTLTAAKYISVIELATLPEDA